MFNLHKKANHLAKELPRKDLGQANNKWYQGQVVKARFQKILSKAGNTGTKLVREKLCWKQTFSFDKFTILEV